MPPRYLFAAALAVFVMGSSAGFAVLERAVPGKLAPPATPRAASAAAASDWDDPELFDPLPACEMPPPEITADERARLQLIGRIAEGVRKVGRWKGGGRWWECGRAYTPAEEADAAIAWAARIVTLAWEYSDRGSANGYQMNPWEIAAVAANESGFDRCVLGKWPRKWGYTHGTMIRSRLTISHSYADAERTLADPAGRELWTTVGLDASPLHLLWRCQDGRCWPKWNGEALPPIPQREVFGLGLGFEYGVRTLKKRAIDHRTSTPSAYWKGYRCDWYWDKIRNWAQRMGARRGEI